MLNIDTEKSDSPLTFRTILLLVVVLAFFYWLGTWQVSLFDRDEPRFAEPAKEMLFATNWKDWIVPHLNGDMHFHKPPFSYWQMALAFKLFGVNEFAARFFSGLWTAATAGLLAGYLSKRFSKITGLAGALAFATSLMTVVEAKLCTADATLGLFTLISVLALWEIYRGAGTLGHKLALWISAGIAILVKGPVIFVLLGGLMAALLVWDFLAKKYAGEKTIPWFWRTGFWWGLPLSLAIGLPWYLAANHLSGGALVKRFVDYDLVRRVEKPVEGHRGFPGYYLVTALIDTWPWSAFLAPVAVYAWRNRWNRDVRFLLAWIVGPTLILELMATKMVHYWLVILPAYSILLARAVDSFATGESADLWQRFRNPVSGVLRLVWIALAIAVLWAAHRYIGMKPEAIIFAIVLILSSAFIFLANRSADPLKHFWAVTWTTVLIMATICVFVLPHFEHYKIGRLLAVAMKQEGGPDSRYALIRWKEESSIYYLNNGQKPVQLGWPADFLTYYSQPDTVIAIEDKAFGDVQKNLPPDLREKLVFRAVRGYDYTLGFKEKTIYITLSKQR